MKFFIRVLILNKSFYVTCKSEIPCWVCRWRWRWWVCELWVVCVRIDNSRSQDNRRNKWKLFIFFLYFLRKLNIINFLFHYFICSILYHILAKKKIFKNPKLILISQNQSNIKYFFFSWRWNALSGSNCYYIPL